MRTKKVKAEKIRIGDVVYGFGAVESIIHLNRHELDIYFEGNSDVFTPNFADRVEIVTHSNGKELDK